MPVTRDLILLFIAYHPSRKEVANLESCLAKLPTNIGYAVVVNDYSPGEPVDSLALNSDKFITFQENIGYGRAANCLFAQLDTSPPYIAVLNTDIFWNSGTFENILTWINSNLNVGLLVPKILNERGEPQYLCKKNPTVLALFSRRFWHSSIKPSWLQRYDEWFVMSSCNYDSVLDSTYLSGCCMVMRSSAFRQVGGFDERFFLYLEDADLCRSISKQFRCVHLPIVSVTHKWGRGNYLKLRLMFVNIISAWKYFSKWGWVFW